MISAALSEAAFIATIRDDCSDAMFSSITKELAEIVGGAAAI